MTSLRTAVARTMLLLATAAGATALLAPASASAAPSRGSISASSITASRSAARATPASNSCHLPTQADPNSVFVASYSNCGVCLVIAGQLSTIFRTYYCTYNPSNNLNDLHYDR